jgi:hypothetical protein
MITRKSVNGKRIDFKLNGRRVFAQNGKNKGMTLEKSTGELMDNSNAAGADKIKLHFVHEKNENWSFVIEDNGSGISSNKIQDCFATQGYDGTYGKGSDSLFGVGAKYALAAMTSGDVCIESINNGTSSYMEICYEDSSRFGISPVLTEKTNKPNGTTILISGVQLGVTDDKEKKVKGKKKTEEDFVNEGIKEIEDLIKWFGFLYFPKKQKYPNYSIDISIKVGGKTTNKKVEFLDPFYRDNSLVKEKGCVNVLHLNENHTEDYYSIEVLPGEFIKVYIACFDKEKMKEEKLFSDFDKHNKNQKGSFSLRKCGIFYKLYNRYVNIGQGNFISVKDQHTLDGLRIELEIASPKLMRLFGVQEDKAEIDFKRLEKTIENNKLLRTLFAELKLIVAAEHNRLTANNKKLSSKELTTFDYIESVINQFGDFAKVLKHNTDLEDDTDKTPKEDEKIYTNTLDSFILYCNDKNFKTGKYTQVSESKYMYNDIEYNYRDTTFIRHKMSGYDTTRLPYTIEPNERADEKDLLIPQPSRDMGKWKYKINVNHPYYKGYIGRLENEIQAQIFLEKISFITAITNMYLRDDVIDKDQYTQILNEQDQYLRTMFFKSKKIGL